MKLKSQQYYSMMAFAVLTVVLLFANAFVTTYIVLTLKLYKSSLFSDDGWGHASMLHTSIYAESIKSEGGSGRGLRLLSDKEVVLSSTAGKATNSSLVIAENGIVAEGGEVHFRTPDGETAFRIARDGAELRAKKLKSLSDKHLELSSTLITQSVRSGAGNDLRLTSPTHSVSIDGPHRLGIRSFGGGIDIEAAKDINIRANNNGKISLEGSSLYLPQAFATFGSPNPATPEKGNELRVVNESAPPPTEGSAYQLCACRDGSVFVTENGEPCRADYHVCPTTAAVSSGGATDV